MYDRGFSFQSISYFSRPFKTTSSVAPFLIGSNTELWLPVLSELNSKINIHSPNLFKTYTCHPLTAHVSRSVLLKFPSFSLSLLLLPLLLLSFLKAYFIPLSLSFNKNNTCLISLNSLMLIYCRELPWFMTSRIKIPSHTYRIGYIV